MGRKNLAFDYSRYKDWIDPAEVTPYENNAKKHDDRQIRNIANSIRRFGWRQECVLTKDNVLVIGHGRRLAALELGCKMPYQVINAEADELTEDDIRELREADNLTNAMTGFDADLLSLDFSELDFEGFDFEMGDFGLEKPISEDGFGEAFSLESGEKEPFTQMTFTLANEQAEMIKTALQTVKGKIVETFGNENSNGNALYEVVREWAALRK